MNVVVIGAGVGGLAAAITCARAGHAVTVIEKNDCVGGKMWAHSARGFTFDCGPSLLTLPTVLQQICGLEYRKLKVQPLQTICRYFWSDGTEIISHNDAERFATSIAHGSSDSAAQYHAYLARTRALFSHIAPLFLTQSIHDISLLRTTLFWRSLARIPLRMSAMSLHQYNARFFRSAKTQQIFDRFATYAGSSPYRTSALYSLISFIEHGIGAYYVPAGIRTIPQLMQGIARKHGAQFCLNQRVLSITAATGRPGGPAARHRIQTADCEYECDAIISNVDDLQTDRLVRTQRAAGATRGRGGADYGRRTRTTSAIVYLWGIDRPIATFGLHNIIFADDYRTEFKQIFVHEAIPPDPTLYINISSKKTPGDAPQNGENWFVMINVPASTVIDWRVAARRLRKTIAKKISRICAVNINQHIVYERILTPTDFAERSCDEYGSLYGRNVHGALGALTRTANSTNKRVRIYRCGGTVHPGGGIPLAILSGQIAATHCDPRNISAPTLEYLAAP